MSSGPKPVGPADRVEHEQVAPFRASLRRPGRCSSSRPVEVSAAKPTTTCPGRRVADEAGQHVGGAHQAEDESVARVVLLHLGSATRRA